jgi:hypothetical protein
MEHAINDELLFDVDSPPIARSHENISIADLFCHLAQDQHHVRSCVQTSRFILAILVPSSADVLRTNPCGDKAAADGDNNPPPLQSMIPPPRWREVQQRRDPAIVLPSRFRWLVVIGLQTGSLSHATVATDVKFANPTPVIVVSKEDSRDVLLSLPSMMVSIGDCNFLLVPQRHQTTSISVDANANAAVPTHSVARLGRHLPGQQYCRGLIDDNGGEEWNHPTSSSSSSSSFSSHSSPRPPLSYSRC